MKCVVFNTFSSLQCEAFTLSLLCDNVQYHLENGFRSEGFLCIHTLADAPWQRRVVSVNAGRLLVELQNSRAQLGELDIKAIASSDRTQTIIEDPRARVVASRVPSLRGSLGLDERVSPSACQLRDVFEPLILDLLRLACAAPTRSRIMVRCTTVASSSQR